MCLFLGQVIKGWDIAVGTMKKGELCDIILKPDYAYGEGGSPPRIPENATLMFEVCEIWNLLITITRSHL